MSIPQRPELNPDYRRGGALGNKLKMTLGLPVYAPPTPPSHRPSFPSPHTKDAPTTLTPHAQWRGNELL